MHFFNPVPLMKLVEVVRGPDTSAEVIAFLAALGKRMGRVPVTVKDAPGFLVNLGGRAYTTEAMRLLYERVATPPQIDAVMRDCCGFRMGPLELADLTGVDVNYPVSQFVYDGYNQDPRLKTSFPHRALMEAGRLGRKSGQGSYSYDEKGHRIDEASGDYLTTAAAAMSLVLNEVDESALPFFAGLGTKLLDSDDGKSPIVAELLGEDCSAHAIRTEVDHRRLVGVDLSCDTSKARYHHDGAGCRSGHARCRGRADCGERTGGDGDQRFARLHRPADARHDRQSRLRDGADRHRRARSDRPRHAPRPQLSARSP